MASCGWVWLGLRLAFGAGYPVQTAEHEVVVPQDLNKKARSALEDLRIATAEADPREELLRRARQE